MLLSPSPSLLVLHMTHNLPFPLPIKLRDTNLDGFMEMLFDLSTLTAGG